MDYKNNLTFDIILQFIPLLLPKYVPQESQKRVLEIVQSEDVKRFFSDQKILDIIGKVMSSPEIGDNFMEMIAGT